MKKIEVWIFNFLGTDKKFFFSKKSERHAFFLSDQPETWPEFFVVLLESIQRGKGDEEIPMIENSGHPT